MDLYDLAVDLAERDRDLFLAGVEADERVRRLTERGIALADAIPGMRLDRCGRCSGNLLIDVDTHKAVCAAGCGWTGHVLRRLP